MNLSELSDAELAETLRKLVEQSRADAANVERLESVVESLHVHRIELEMQNRALRESQAELEHALARYADLYDHLPIGYVTLTHSGKITGANAAAIELLQTARDKLVGGVMTKFFAPYDAGRFAAHLETCAKGREKNTIELSLRLPDGTSRLVQLASRQASLSEAGGLQIHTAITDVSALKNTQQALEAINREQEVFNHSLSHDLRAPLVAISNYARLVLTEHSTAVDPEGLSMVKRIEASASRMEQILKNVLEYNQVTREEIALHSVNVEDVVRHVLAALRPELEAHKAQVSVDGPLPRVMASRLALNQVFKHLLSNAVTYTKPGEPPRVRFSAEDGLEKVIVKVTDEGIGIDRRYHERIFGMFERLHGYSRYAGSGLGLAIVRRAMERMRGRIWVESEPGKGSCFCLELPKA